MPAYADARPPGLSLDFRPGNALTVTLDWPTGSLTGRTFSSTLGTSTLTVAVVGDTMTVEATTTQTGSVSVPTAWSLLETIDGVAQPIIVGTWAPSTLAATNNAAVQVVTEPNVTVDVTVTSGTAGLIAHEREMDGHRPIRAISRFRAEVNRTRSETAQDINARSSTVVIGPGDSLSEAFSPSVRGLMWPLILARRLNGHSMRSVQFIPASANTFNTVTASAWPGSQAPWVYSSTPTADVLHGPDLHAVIMVSGSTATLTFFGEIVIVAYTRTTTGPTAAAVTLDGVSQTAINANGSELPGQLQVYSADGYGFHTLVITSTSGQLNLEGATVTDNEPSVLGVPTRAVRVLTFAHGGFSTQDYIDRPNWSTSLVNLSANLATGIYPSIFVVGLGANDQVASRTQAAYEANLLSILNTIDTKLVAAGITTEPGFLLLTFPGLDDIYIDGMWNVRDDFDEDRVGVLDLTQYFPVNASTPWDILDSASHPFDGGQLFIANAVADYLDGFTNIGQPRISPATSRLDVVIEAVTPADYRNNWTESLALTSAAGGEVYDASPADAGVNERRHRRWFERGTYEARLRYGEVTTTGGQAQILVGGTSLGTQSTTGTTGNVAEVTLGTTIAIDSAGAYPVTIRCTTANSASFRFIRLFLRRIS